VPSTLIARVVCLVPPTMRKAEVDDHVRTGEGRPQRLLVADVALPVLHLRPAVLRRVERPPGDPDDAVDPRVVLQQRHEAEAEGAGRAGDGDGQSWSAMPARLPRSR
jgi:hypothetical protein